MTKMRSAILIAAFYLGACASTEQLRTQPNCSVWKDQGSFGPFHVEVNNNKVKAKTKCLLYFWLCTSFESYIDDDGQILAKGPGLFNDFQHIASLKDDSVNYDHSFLEKFVKSSPISLDMKNHSAKRTIELTMISGTKNETELEFSPSCTKTQAAVGAVSVWILENIH